MWTFEGFKRRAVVYTLEADEYKTRMETLAKTGSSVPAGILNEIKMNFKIPKVEETDTAFEEVQFIGVEDKEKGEEIYEKLKEEAKNAPADISRLGGGRPNMRGNWNNSPRGNFHDRRDSQGSPFRGNRGNFNNFNRGGSFNNRGGFINRGGFDNRRGGFHHNNQRGGFKPGGQQQFGGFQPQANHYNASASAQAGWTPQQQIWAQQWQQYY